MNKTLEKIISYTLCAGITVGIAYSGFFLGNLTIRPVIEYTIKKLLCRDINDYEELPENSSLEINLKPYCVRKSQEEGEKELIKLSERVPYEGSWVFLSDEAKWFNVLTKHEEINTEDEHVFSANSDLILFLDLKKPFIDYHIHPESFIRNKHKKDYFKYLFGDISEESEPGIFTKAKRATNACTHIVNCFPSPVDFDCSIFFGKKFMKVPLVYNARIVSPLGVTILNIIDPSEETVNLYKSIHHILLNIALAKGVSHWQTNNTVEIYPDRVFDFVNEELKGKASLEFIPRTDMNNITQRIFNADF